MAVRPVTAFPGAAACHGYWNGGVSRISDCRDLLVDIVLHRSNLIWG